METQFDRPDVPRLEDLVVRRVRGNEVHQELFIGAVDMEVALQTLDGLVVAGFALQY